MNRNKFIILLFILTISSINLSYGINAKQLKWKLWGYRPNTWRMNFDFNQLSGTWAEYSAIPYTVPGSVQNALKAKGIIPDWNIGLNHIQHEWIENRHWIIATKIPDEWIDQMKDCILFCKGPDHQGILYVNGKEAGRFNNAFVPWSFDIGPFLKDKNNPKPVAERLSKIWKNNEQLIYSQ